jgi:hypothetical protein
MDITTATPAEIDAVIFANLQTVWAARDFIVRLTEQAHREAGDRKQWIGRQARWTMSDEQAWVAVDSAKLIAERDGAQAEYEEAYKVIRSLDAEYLRRGGWTRAYLVDNADGHVHNTERCSSFRMNTRYHWLTEQSGKPEAEIVELAGERACTICYPSAPVDVLSRPSKLEGPAQAAAREAAEVRKTEKAARDAKKAEKAIANPDGSPLKGKYGPLNTVVSAWSELVTNVFDARYYGYHFDAPLQDRILSALVAKTGQPVEEIVATMESKVAAKARREKVSR